MSIQLLTSKEQFEQAVRENDELLLLKHSLTCPISSEAKEQYEEYANETALPTYIIHIQDNRDVSNYVAEHFGIKHESPQVFFIKNGEVKYHSSHWEITVNNLKEAVS